MSSCETLADIANNTHQKKKTQQVNVNRQKKDASGNTKGSQRNRGNQDKVLEQVDGSNQDGVLQILQSLVGVVQQQASTGNDLKRLMEQQQQ